MSLETISFPLCASNKSGNALSENSLDCNLVARATRLLIAYVVSLVLLASAIIVSYVVLNEEIVTQRVLSEANSQISVLQNSVNESVGLMIDYREAAGTEQSRLVQVIDRRIQKIIEELQSHVTQLDTTLARLEKTTYWSDVEPIQSLITADDRNAVLARYISKMSKLVQGGADSETATIGPQIPAEVAGSRYGAMSTQFRQASEQLAETIVSNLQRISLIHKRLTSLILVMFLLVSALIVLPLWQRLIKEHRRYERAHETLHHYAYTDQETGLLNLDGFERRLLQQTTPPQLTHGYCLLLIRLRNLDEIYNLIDSQRVASLHQAICDRLRSSKIGDAGWSRSGEAEYATVVAKQVMDKADEWIEQFVDELSEPVNVAGVRIRPLVNMAASELGERSVGGSSLLRGHQAKARMALPLFDRAAPRVPAYEVALTHDLIKQNDLITAITDGISRNEFVPFYQIKVDAVTGKPSSLEVLCRWEKDSGIVGPDEFIAAAEKSGQIVPLTYQLLNQVVRDVTQWSNRGVVIGSVAINVTADVLQHKDFISRVSFARQALLAVHSDLEVEITENVAIDNSAGNTRRTLKELAKLGIRIAIDDFGTGYASLQTLLDLPFDVLKIDRSFIAPMSRSGAGCEVVSAMISLCSTLDKRSVIEGVEFEWQWRQLAKMGADELQGFVIHEPACASATSAWLECRQELLATG